MAENIEITDTFKKLSEPARKLLIAMTHLQEFGGTKPAILAGSGFENEQFDKAIEELKQFNLAQSGKISIDDEKRSFIVGEGDRFRQAPGVQEAVYKDILKMEPPKSLFKKSL